MSGENEHKVMAEGLVGDALAEKVAEEAARLERETGEPTTVVIRVKDDSDLDDLPPSINEPESRTFETLDDLLEAEKLEKEGVEREFPLIPGWVWHICHASAAQVAYAEYVRRWRTDAKKGQTAEPDEALKAKFLRASLFGTVARGWHGAPNGMEFNESNYRKAIKSRHVFEFVMGVAGELDATKKLATEGDAKK